MRLYSQKDVDRKALTGVRIAVLGYGSQGRAHALNLRDSGLDVVVGVRRGESWKKAKRDGLKVMEPAQAVKDAGLVAMLVITGATRLTVSTRVALVVPVTLVALTATLNTPVCVGVPLITCVPALNDRPVGSPVAVKPVGALLAVSV